MTFTFRSGTHAGRTFFVLLHSSAVPDADRWNAYLDAVASALAASGGDRTDIFVATDGGGPDPGQRKALAQVFERGNALTHVFTNDIVVRGIVTAFRWIAGARAVAHQPREFAKICVAYGHEPAAVLACMDEAQRDLEPVQMIAELRRGAPRRQ